MGKYEVLPSDVFYAKRIEKFSSDTSEIRTNYILTFFSFGSLFQDFSN